MAFHNTINASGQQLIDFERSADSCKLLVLKIFQNNPDTLLTPHEVKRRLDRIAHKDYPITSVRRALTDLTGKNEGYKLRKTMVQTMEGLGKPNYHWRLNTNR